MSDMRSLSTGIAAAALAAALAGCGRSASSSPHPIAQIMCQDPQTFRQCYGADETKCVAWANDAVSRCLRELPPPDRSKSSVHDFGLWGVKIGHCSERAYHEAHKSTFLANESTCASQLANRMARDQAEAGQTR